MGSQYLKGLSGSERKDLVQGLANRQNGTCYLCGKPIDVAEATDNDDASLHIEHVEPIREGGKDEPANFALVHANCNKSRQAGDLRVARILAQFDSSQTKPEKKQRSDAPTPLIAERPELKTTAASGDEKPNGRATKPLVAERPTIKPFATEPGSGQGLVAEVPSTPTRSRDTEAAAGIDLRTKKIAPSRRERSRPRRVSRRVQRIEKVFDSIRLRIIAAANDYSERRGAIVIVLTSRTPGEGVSTVAGGLARSFARNGDDRILLVDAAENGNRLTQRLPGSGPTPIKDPANLVDDDNVIKIDNWGVDAMALANGADGRFPYENGWSDTFENLRNRYDVVVVDAGALSTDTPYRWASVSTQVILVIDTQRTTVQAIERLRDELSNATLTLSSVVLNKRDFPIPSFFY